MARNDNKTQPTAMDPAAFIAAVEPASKAADAARLDRLFRDVTGFQPVMWGPTIIGYGKYHYVTKSKREGDFLATGYSPRKAAHSIYVMPGYGDFGHILNRLGKHRMGKSCLYVNKLADIDLDVLAELIRAGLADLGARYVIEPT